MLHTRGFILCALLPLLFCLSCQHVSVADASTTVYETEFDQRYHKSDCAYVHKGSGQITLQAAKAKGLTPCPVCNP
jgi:hypothetical protein